MGRLPGGRTAAEERRLISEFGPLQARADAAVQALEELLRARDIPGLTAFAAREMYPALDPLQAVLAALTQVQLDTARSTYETAETRYASTRAGVIAAVLAGMVFAIGFGALVVRGILREARRGARRRRGRGARRGAGATSPSRFPHARATRRA